MVDGATPCRPTWNFGSTRPPLERNRRFWTSTRSLARSPSAVTPSEKSSIKTNRKLTTCFPMSLRWSSYVALSPQRRDQKRETAVFCVKSHFAWRKCATKFLCVKTVSDKVARHSLAQLSVQKWLVGDVPFYAKIWWMMTNPFAMRRFSIYFRP